MPYPTTRTTLLRSLNSGEAAWTEFFDRYREIIADIGRFKGLSPDECGELVQNVMIRFHNKIQAGFTYDPNLARFRTFFSRLIQGCIWDILRKRDRHCFAVAEVPETAEGERPDELLDMALLEKWRTILSEEAMLELAHRVDEKTFQAFELYALESKPVKETAELLGLSVNSVYVAKTRCIKILRGIVARLNSEDPELKLDV
ncbi:MAG: sigma-70 family RNA polymerase sigma factor [Lentisphaeria bacterium]|nr:sigma-70 family RNA polymerase sigma factor [Lentisphaeria bacterium]